MAGFSCLPGERIQMVLKGTIFGQQTRTVLYWEFRDTGPAPAGIDASDIVAALLVDVLPDILPMQSLDFIWTGADLRHLVPLFGAVWQSTFAVNGAVSIAGAPPAVTWNIKRSTGAVGRTSRTRAYMPGLPETFTIAGQLVLAALPLAATAATALITSLETGVVGRFFVPVLCGIDPAGGASNVRYLTVASVDPIVRTQRRREIGVGI